MSREQRIQCPRHHWAFSVTAEGIAYKCRAGECRVVYTVSWKEIEAKRQQIQESIAVSVPVVGKLQES